MLCSQLLSLQELIDECDRWLSPSDSRVEVLHTDQAAGGYSASSVAQFCRGWRVHGLGLMVLHSAEAVYSVTGSLVTGLKVPRQPELSRRMRLGIAAWILHSSNERPALRKAPELCVVDGGHRGLKDYRLAYRIIFDDTREGGPWLIDIDALTGRVLNSHSLMVAAYVSSVGSGTSAQYGDLTRTACTAAIDLREHIRDTEEVRPTPLRSTTRAEMPRNRPELPDGPRRTKCRFQEILEPGTRPRCA